MAGLSLPSAILVMLGVAASLLLYAQYTFSSSHHVVKEHIGGVISRDEALSELTEKLEALQLRLPEYGGDNVDSLKSELQEHSAMIEKLHGLVERRDEELAALKEQLETLKQLSLQHDDDDDEAKQNQHTNQVNMELEALQEQYSQLAKHVQSKLDGIQEAHQELEDTVNVFFKKPAVELEEKIAGNIQPKSLTSSKRFRPSEFDPSEDAIEQYTEFGIQGTLDSSDPEFELQLIAPEDLDDSDTFSSVECRGHSFNRSCLFTNLYMDRHGFFTAHRKGAPLGLFSKASDYVINRDGKFGHPWHPQQRMFEGDLHFQREIAKSAPSGVLHNYNGLHLYFHTMWESNVGHGLWDGIYPAFISLLRFHGQLKPLRMIPSLPEDDGKPCGPPNTKGCQCREIIKRFGRRGMVRLQDLFRLTGEEGKVLRFDRVIIGSGHMAQRYMTADLSLPGGRSLNATDWFRRQMYWAHDVPLRPLQGQRSNRDIRGIVVDNRRFSKQEREEIDSAIALAKTEDMEVTYIYWQDYNPFSKQLELLAKVNSRHVSRTHPV